MINAQLVEALSDSIASHIFSRLGLRILGLTPGPGYVFQSSYPPPMYNSITIAPPTVPAGCTLDSIKVVVGTGPLGNGSIQSPPPTGYGPYNVRLTYGGGGGTRNGIQITYTFIDPSGLPFEVQEGHSVYAKIVP